MRRVPALVLALLVAVLAVIGLAAPASAHATLVSSDPTEGAVLPSAPAAVSFTFDESVQLVPKGLLAFDASGESVKIKPSARGRVVTGDLPKDLDDGTYVITWRVVSNDGHPIAGSLTFHVGAPSEKVTPPQTRTPDAGVLPTLQAIVHGLDYVALLLAGGLAFFLAWTVRGVRLTDDVRRQLVRILRGSAIVAVVAAALAVPLSGAYQLGTGASGLFDPAALDPSLVGEDLIVLALQVVGLGAAVWSTTRAKAQLATDLATGVAVWSPALVGHTRAYEPASLLVVTDALHLTAGAVWLGGLVGLAVALRSVARSRDAALLLARFSTVAAALLAVLATSGILLGWRIVGSWSRLFGETYGRLLLIKVALVLIVVGLAAYNRYRLVPQVSAKTKKEQQRQGSDLVRKVVVAEGAVLVAVLVVTGFLTQKPPGGEPPVQPAPAVTGVIAGKVDDDLKVLAVLDAGPGLQRRLIVQIQNVAGEPLDLYDAPVVALRSVDVDLGEIPVEPTATGTYQADVVFPKAGTWQLQVSVRVDEFTNPVTTVDLEVS